MGLHDRGGDDVEIGIEKGSADADGRWSIVCTNGVAVLISAQIEVDQFDFVLLHQVVVPVVFVPDDGAFLGGRRLADDDLFLIVRAKEFQDASNGIRVRCGQLVAGLHKVRLDEDLLALDAAEYLVLNELERLVDIFGSVVALDQSDRG